MRRERRQSDDAQYLDQDHPFEGDLGRDQERDWSDAALGMFGRAAVGAWRFVVGDGPVRISSVAFATVVGGLLGIGMIFAPSVREVAATAHRQISAALLARPEFVIRRVEVIGARHVSDVEILAALGLAAGPVQALAFDAQAARQNVEALGWVARARVRALPPQLVEVHLEEREPAALWRRDGRLALIDASGVVIADALDPYAGVTGGAAWRELLSLPVLVGDGAEAAAQEAAMLDASARSAGLQVLAWTRIGARRWDLEMLDGSRIMLPEAEPLRALKQLISWADETDLMDQAFTVIDLRNPTAPVGRRAG